MTAKKVFVDFVKLLEIPTRLNPFYVVQSPKGVHYVSGLGGKPVTGAAPGTRLKLYKSSTAQMSALLLERI